VILQKFDMAKKGSTTTCWRSSGISQFAAYMVSDFSAYINGEVVVIDGGEWLKRWSI
jgi:enoyl-[acyl-carrier-protein] reductase (NADH)